MQSIKFALSVLLTVKVLTAIGQVPIIAEPKPFQFPVYPNTVIKSNITTTGNQVYNPLAVYNIPRPGASSEEQRRAADEDIRRYELEKAQRQNLIDQANNELDATHIEYQLPFNDLPEKKLYFDAFNYFKKVLSGEESMNLEAAVFFVEHAFDPSLDYNEFSQQLSTSTNVIGLKMQQDRISPDDNLGKIMTTFKFVADTNFSSF